MDDRHASEVSYAPVGFVLGIINIVARFLVIAVMDPYFLRPDDRAIVEIFPRTQGVEYR